MMGSPTSESGRDDDERQHRVTVGDFFIGKYEVTHREYIEFLNDARVSLNGSYNRNELIDMDSDNCAIGYRSGNFYFKGSTYAITIETPVIEVTWHGAVEYCNWRSLQEGYQQLYDPCDPNWTCDFSKNGYRLPTEAEWEYAGRGGLANHRFPWGDAISHSQANYYSYWSAGTPYYDYDVSPTEGYHSDWNDGIVPYTSPVGSFPANGYGLYDMAGNVYDWCNDWYSGYYYSSSPTNNPTGPINATYSRVLRGGGWNWRALWCRVSYRYHDYPNAGSPRTGFRIVLDLN